MLFSLALLFLLTPFPSLQTPVTNEKINATGTGSEPKHHVLLTLSLAKPNTAATLVKLTKETPKPTPKALSPIAANQTHPAPSTPLKPPTATFVKLTKETPKPTPKALSPTAANQTHPAPLIPLKPPTAMLVKLTKETPKSTPKALSPIAANQTHPAPSTPLKPPTATLIKLTKETPKPTPKALSPTAANQTHPAPSTPLKPPTATFVKLTKETPKPTPKALSPTAANQTHPAPLIPLKPPTAMLVKLTRETPKSTPKALSPIAANQTHPAPSTPLKPPTATLIKLSKETPKPTPKALSPTVANQTHPAPLIPLKPPTATLVKLTKETPKPTPKAISPNAANQTHPAPLIPLKPPTATLVKLTKETPKPTPKAISPTAANQTHPAPSTPLKPPTATLVKLIKETPKPTPKVLSPTEANQILPAPSTPLKPPKASGPKTTTKNKPSQTPPHPNPIKVLITSDSGCISKDTQSDASNRTKEQPQTQTQTHELKLKPGSPLTLTHRISLVPTSCTGGCVAEMAALKGRVGRLEKEMSLLKSKCASCSKGPCPNDCSANGKCEKGKCVCLPGFLGPDCTKCAPGADCSKKGTKDKIQITAETVALKVSPESNAIKESLQGKKTIADQTIFQKKTEQKKPTAAKEGGDIKSKTKVTTSLKTGLTKTPAKQGVTVTKTKIKVSTRSNATKIGLVRPTVGQVLLKHHGGRKQESKGKTTVLKKQSKPDLKLKATVKEKSAGKANAKAGNLQDQPQANVTLSTVKTSVNKTRSGKETLEQSTLAEKNVTLTSGKKTVKKVKLVQGTMNITKVSLAIDSTKAGTGKITLTKGNKTEADISSGTSKTTVKAGSGKGKPVPQKSQCLVNVTTVETTSEVKVLSNKTTIIQCFKDTTKKAGTGVGSGLGSVKVQNITTYGFTLTWSAPTAMFKNFTVSRREHRAKGEEEEEEEVEEAAAVGGEDRVAAVVNTTIEIQKQSESTNGTITFPTKAPGSSRGKAHTKRVSIVLPDSVRSVEFSNLRPQTRYSLHIFGTAPGSRSKIHRVTAMTGPEPPTELLFGNMTEASLSVSWSKPKSTLSGFKITYTHSVTGESGSVSVDSLQSQVSLSKLSSGATYEVSVMSTMGKRESDPLTAIITTVPAPPTVLQAINITDTKAVLQWTPAMGKVDRFILSYESAKTPNVTVTVMVSGNSVEHQLRGLQRATLYTVKVLSQKDSLQSTAITTTFTTASAVKVGEVGARSAVVSWKAPSVAFSNYRVTYQTAGEEAKEVILDSTVTEYKLTGLFSMSKYTVLVQGEREGQYTSIVTTEFITGKLLFPFPTECSQELLNGVLQSREVDLYPEGKEGKTVRVYCDMETEGGGWTVFQRRMNGKADFYRTWSDYTNGFGNLSEEFWLGNELLHNLTSMGPVTLRVDLRSGNDTAYAHYSSFTIDSEAKHYAIEVSGYTGTAGDSMRYHNGRPFSTRDKEPHPLGIHCARAYMGGWWYKNCYKTNLNGLYGTNSNNQGVVWIDWKGKDSSIPFTEMKFRPAGFSVTTHG